MGRAKLNLELIQKEKARHNTFQKRKSGLFKKISEFKILCDVDACMIIYGPNNPNKLDDRSHPISPEIWPSEHAEVRKVIHLYNDYQQSNKEDTRGTRRTTDLSDFYRERKRKAEVNLAKLRCKMGAARFPAWDERLDVLNADQLRDLGAVIDTKLLEVNKRLDWLKGTTSSTLHHQQHHFYLMSGGGGIGGVEAMDLVAQQQSKPITLMFSSNLNNINNNNNVNQYYLEGVNNNIINHQNMMMIQQQQHLLPMTTDFYCHAAPPVANQFVSPLDHIAARFMDMNEDDTGFGSEYGGGFGSEYGGGAANVQCCLWKGGLQYYSDPIGLLDSMCCATTCNTTIDATGPEHQHLFSNY